MLLHNTYRHPALAEGRPVHYAGEAYFNNGRLKWWSNGSGNYRPDAAHAEQAGLPMDRFFTYEEIMRGEHQRSASHRTDVTASSAQMFPQHHRGQFVAPHLKLRRF